MNPPSRASHYLHGTDPQEQIRLRLMNRIMNSRALGEMHIRPGESILDVGCGLGQLTRDLARQAAPGRVVGVDRSSQQLSEAIRLAAEENEADLVEFRLGQADHLPLQEHEWGTFDIAHARFVLEHVPEPLAVVQQMSRALRPGARLILQDDSHDVFRIWPESPGFDRLWQNYIRTYDRVGNDPYIGHRLISLLHQAGVTPTRNTWLFFGACAGERELLDCCVRNVIEILRGVRGPILNLGDFDSRTFELVLEEFQNWSFRPDAAMWYAVSWAEGQKPANGTGTLAGHE